MANCNNNIKTRPTFRENIPYENWKEEFLLHVVPNIIGQGIAQFPT